MHLSKVFYFLDILGVDIYSTVWKDLTQLIPFMDLANLYFVRNAYILISLMLFE